MPSPPGLTRRAIRRVRADIRTDPYLAYILLLALLLAVFGVWHRIPNFATWDEHSRVLDPLVMYARVVADPSIESLRSGIAWGRAPFGATFYVYAMAVAPVVLVAVLTGNADALAALEHPTREYAHYATWAATPRWVWTWSILFVRLTNVVFAVVTVYLLYRLGTRLSDRATGRLAALLLAVTFGFLKLAKEGGEDIPATMCLVGALYLLVGYLQTGSRRQFYAASMVGGLGIAFKLTLAPLVPIFGLAFLLRARTAGGRWYRALWQPRLLAVGAYLGAAVILMGFPTALVGNFEAVGRRLFGRTGRASLTVGPTAPLWWWFLRTYASAFGWPLLLAAVGGVTASVVHLLQRFPARDRLRERVPGFDERALLVACLGAFLLFFAGWHDFRVHHLLPTFPLVAVLVADSLDRLRAYREPLGRAVMAMLVVSSAVYAGLGVALYASMPRDDATDWLNENTDENATMEAYFHGFVENAVPHSMDVNPVWNHSAARACPEYIQIGYKDLLYLRDIPLDQRANDVDFRVSARATYIRALLSGEYNYEIVREFGTRPDNFVPDRPEPGNARDLLPLGIDPHSDQYGDEQELRANQYVAILRHNGTCETGRSPPW